MNRFEGRSVLITGAGRGQGRAHAVSFAREGADVAVCDIGADIASVPYGLASGEDLAETARLIEAEGGRAVAEEVDVRDYASVKRFADHVLSEFGQIDVLVTNAGILSFAQLVDLEEQEFGDMFDVNVKGVWHAVKAVVPAMARRGYGRVVITGSVGSLIAFPNLGHYCAAKHALHGLTKALALEQAANGITVNLVCPSTVNTKMIRNPAAYALMSPDDPTDEAAAAVHAGMNAMGVPWVEPEDVSRIVLFLTSEECRYTTGAAITVDLGFTAS